MNRRLAASDFAKWTAQVPDEWDVDELCGDCCGGGGTEMKRSTWSKWQEMNLFSRRSANVQKGRLESIRKDEVIAWLKRNHPELL